MSRFLTDSKKTLVPYTPGEQPRDMAYVKLNTNESPYPPSPGVLEAVEKEAGRLQLYSDPTCRELTLAVAGRYGVQPEQVILVNGSDEVLNFAFMAWCDKNRPAVFPDITYGFYKVFADLHGVPYREIPLGEDFSVNPADYVGAAGTVFIANPNAPTGLCLSLPQIEGILQANPDQVVVMDEAYVDFGAQSAVKLVDKYDNLLVTQTFSKSRSLAGARLGFGIGSAALIQDLQTIRNSTNPYNVNRMTAAAGVAALAEDNYYMDNGRRIMNTRQQTTAALEGLGFTVLPSLSNFVFATHPAIAGGDLYRRLKAAGVLVRHFDKPRIHNFVRITIGTPEQMDTLLSAIKTILEE